MSMRKSNDGIVEAQSGETLISAVPYRATNALASSRDLPFTPARISPMSTL